MAELGDGQVVLREKPVRRGPSYMRAVALVVCIEFVLVAVMRAAQTLEPGGLVERLGVWLHWPALWAARELEALWLVTFFQVVLASLPVYALMWVWRLFVDGGRVEELPPLSEEVIREHVEGVGRRYAGGRAEGN